MELEDKIKKIKDELRDESIEMMAQFDIKDAEEDGVANCKVYLNKYPDKKWDGLKPWQKLCCYKISDSAGVDCDAALRSTVIYQLAFGYDNSMRIEKYKKGQYQLESDKLILRGDTMNSYATTVYEFLETYNHQNEKVGEFLKNRKRKYTDWDVCILENYDYFSKIMPDKAPDFFALYHTVGNFMVTPYGCNGPRGIGPVKDY